MYACQAQVIMTHKDGWRSSRQVPTFYLHDTHYTEEGANRAACAIVDPFNLYEVHMSVVKI